MDINQKMNDFRYTHRRVIASSNFASNLISELLKKRYVDAELSKWSKRSPIEVYKHIIETLEATNTPHCSTYWRPSSAVAKVSGDAILFNRMHLGGLDDVDGGSTILHERGHIQMGFDHDFWATKERPDSLCYLLNRVFEQTAVELGLNTLKVGKRASFWDRFKFWRWL